jgi:hypothetical protein
MKYLYILLVIFLMPFGLQAQIVFSEVGAGFSSWSRIYTTPDETSLLTNPSLDNGKTNTVIIPSLYGKLDLSKTFALKGRVGYAKNSFESISEVGGLSRNEQLSQAIIPLGLTVELKFPISKKSGVGKESQEADEGDADKNVEVSNSDSKSFFIGGFGLSRYFIQHSFSRTIIGGEGSIPESKFSGNDYGLTAMLGYSNYLSDKLVLTIFSQYNIGSYDQRVYLEGDNAGYEVKNISLQGLEFGVSLGFRLN